MKKSVISIAAAFLCSVTAIPKTICGKSIPTKFTSTFIQNWYCRDWTLERWVQEFSAAESAGFDSMIIQSTYDIVRGECPDGGNKHDPSSYSSVQSFCMYPSEHETDYHSSQNNGDALELALKAAKETGMKLWLGTVSDDMWWNYGWGPPDTYFENWSISNAGLCKDLINEMWQRYGENYGEQIAGWYYTNEIWNIDSACLGTDNGEYARIIGENISSCIDAVNRSCPDKPLLISPFYNADICTSTQFTDFMSDVISNAGFRPIDIYAGQDGGGREYTSDVIREWALAQKKAVDGRMRFWINNECFDSNLTPKSVAELRENYSSTADISEGNIIFSWNHYYASDPNLNGEFTEFTSEMIDGDVNCDGKFNAADLVAVYKWLASSDKTQLLNWNTADFCRDGRLDIFDACLMRKRILSNYDR